MENLKSFQLWLENHQLSPSTVRNYLNDVSRYLSSGVEINAYLESLKSDPNYSRYLSSLKKYIAFALDQSLISKNPISVRAGFMPAPSLTDHVFQFKSHLEKHHTPVSTIRNYVNDLVQYVTWLDSTPVDPQTTN